MPNTKNQTVKATSFLFFICLLIQLTGPISNSRAQTQGMLSGRVSDEQGQAIKDASIILLNSNYSSLSNEQGFFRLDGITRGNYMLQVSAPGFASIHREVEIPAGQLQLILSRASDKLEAVTVTAQKREEDLQRVPFSISTLSPRKVEEYQLWNSRDLAAIVPNLYAAHPGDNRNVISLRGIATTSYDPTVATYIDGVNQFGLDTYIAQLLDIERIEVLRGPQGTLYGRNAMGGVINIITRQPGNRSSGYFKTDIGNYGLQRYAFGLQTPLVPNKLFAGVAGMYDQHNGFYENSFNQRSYDQRHSFMGNYYLKYLPSSQWALTVNVKHDQNRNKGAFPLAGNPEAALENPYEISQNALTTLIDNTFNASLSANYYGDAFNFSAQTAWQNNHRYYTEPIDGDFSAADAIAVVNNYGDEWNNVKVLTQEFRFTSAENREEALEWTAGLYGFYQDNPVKQGTYFGEDAPAMGMDPSQIGSTMITTNEGNGYGLALYGQGTYHFSQRFSVTAGLRYDHEQKELSVRGEYQAGEDPPAVIRPDTAGKASFNALSPKLSLGYAIQEDHHAYLSYSRGFRAGGITQYSGDPGQPPLYPYDPEYSNNFEAGIKNMLADGKVRLNFSAFYTRVNDAQVPTLILPEAFTITRNVGELESKGLELEVAATPVRGLEAAWNAGYTDATYSKLEIPGEEGAIQLDGNRQLFTPDLTSMLSLQYSYTPPASPGIRLILGGQWHYTGDQYFNLKNTIEQQGYHLFHARAGVAAGKLEAFLWSRNISDRHYIDYAYDFGASHLGNPQTYGVSVTLKL